MYYDSIDNVCRTITKSSNENPDPHQKCMFPIIHEDKWIEKCIKKEEGDAKSSCPTERIYIDGWKTKKNGKWGICNQSCQKNTSKYGYFLY